MVGPSHRSPVDLEKGTLQGARSSSEHSPEDRYTDANPQRCCMRVSTGGILCPADAETNQCLLYAVLNVLSPDRAVFEAVTAGNSQQPTRDIVSYLDSRGVRGEKGYTALSLTWYFTHLVKIGRIHSFEWYRLNGDQFRAMLSDVFSEWILHTVRHFTRKSGEEPGVPKSREVGAQASRQRTSGAGSASSQRERGTEASQVQNDSRGGSAR